MIDIGIPEVNVTAKYEDTDGRSIKYDAEAAIRPSKCPNPVCKSSCTPTKHDKTAYFLHDVKTEGKLSYINLCIRRYKCPECGNVFPDEFTFFPKRQHLTNRLKNEIVNRCIKGETFRYIATDYGIDPNTVSTVFKEYTAAHKDELTYDYTPEVLGIDEAHIDDHYRLVLTDVKEQRLLDIKPNNALRTVKSYLKTLDSNVCTCATMDFAPAYAKAVSIVLPKALIVIDKFHVIQDINHCLDNVRKQLQNQYREQGIDIRRFKRAKYLFMTNWEDLTDNGHDRLNDWFNEFGELYDAYMCKETFRDIYAYAETREQATAMYDSWIDSIPDFEKFEPMRKTMTRRKEHILNYWDAPYTNAYTESVNNGIKRIEKAGRGYKFENLRERCLLELNRPKPDKFDPKTAIYVMTAGEDKSAKKVKKLYAPKAKPEYKEKPAPKHRTDGFAFDFVPRMSDKIIVYEPHKGHLKDYLTVYLEYHDEKHRQESFMKRMNEYYRRLKELGL